MYFCDKQISLCVFVKPFVTSTNLMLKEQTVILIFMLVVIQQLIQLGKQKVGRALVSADISKLEHCLLYYTLWRSI